MCAYVHNTTYYVSHYPTAFVRLYKSSMNLSCTNREKNYRSLNSTILSCYSSLRFFSTTYLKVLGFGLCVMLSSSSSRYIRLPSARHIIAFPTNTLLECRRRDVQCHMWSPSHNRSPISARHVEGWINRQMWVCFWCEEAMRSVKEKGKIVESEEWDRQ